MDLLATVRKEGSRGGRGDFKWSDVQNSTHRENYLGHSVMAPVGRWQKGRDLTWYSKGGDDGDGSDAAEQAARERREELRRVKEAEQDAMARALGLPVPDRTNANLQEVSNKRDLNRMVKDSIDNEDRESGKGVGFDGTSAGERNSQVLGERLEDNAESHDKELQYALREYRRRHGEHKQSQRSRSKDRERRDHHNKRDRPRDSHPRPHHSSTGREKDRKRRSRSRSRSRSRDRRDRDSKRRERSRSPYRRDSDRVERRRR